MYHYDGECFSNDPANPKGPKLRTWQEPIGSIRPIRGMDCTSLRVVVTMDWANLKAEHKMEVVETNEAKNTKFEYEVPSWQRIKDVSSFVSHTFQLSEPVKGCTGVTFQLENVPKSGIPFTTSGTIMETGTDFRQELNSLMTFQTENSASRSRERKEVIRFPPFLQPKTQTKVSIVVHSGVITIPFSANFTSGNSAWTVTGVYTGIDATQVKLDFQETSLLEGNRKASRMNLA
ncbi:uncharacterized protein LOC111702033 [Eurytemora carolleeae]|uniref:uncharacterized protein LOC111702033 n=1 Tax=Eurytemora carolleeae TaxID=1294199 RepID=UPI000C77AE57|nr:uncharacterized protein LOC111702033 [Eurytemora carolleeae]|eukprot:XP_023329323.1 uncharacterized protein LOC111702033 [Eurytemora affinis]